MAVPAAFNNALALSQQAAQDDAGNMFSAFERFVTRVEGIMAKQADANTALEKQNADLRATIAQDRAIAEAKERASRDEIAVLSQRITALEGRVTVTEAVANTASHVAFNHNHTFWGATGVPPERRITDGPQSY